MTYTTIGEADLKLKTRIEELDAVADHLPTGVLGQRLLAAIEDRIGGGFEAINIWARFDELQEPDGEPDGGPHDDASSAAAEAGHVGRWVEVPVAPASPRETRFDPGVPQRDADLAVAMPETAEEGLEEPEPESGPDAQQAIGGVKLCEGCGNPKPLSAFGKHNKSADGLKARCEECRAPEIARQKAAARRGLERRWRGSDGASSGGVTIVEDRRQEQEGAEARLCANAGRCVAADPDDLVPQPAVLDDANEGPLCRRCARRAGIA